jgi:hypothetical protein
VATEFEAILVAAFTELYIKLYYFNNAEDIFNLLLKLVPTRKPVIRELITGFLGQILEDENPSLCILIR